MATNLCSGACVSLGAGGWPGGRLTMAFARHRAGVKIAGLDPRRLYILCWREHDRRKLSPTLAAPTTLALTTLVAQCELSRR